MTILPLFQTYKLAQIFKMLKIQLSSQIILQVNPEYQAKKLIEKVHRM